MRIFAGNVINVKKNGRIQTRWTDRKGAFAPVG